ncbi:hypothetical protein FB567DRAFT_320443 [Paraphoma chrysanthemicola]|uniref:Uncharacterized protein n=1 Tax=Paraphoma chrysanthemicola TaxID=798071 RepID=A0A8K0VZX8_9PLEO|nr:hypothetical protein FB567DRAFT_320443 [Paraphoma chrysanthemicola]
MSQHPLEPPPTQGRRTPTRTYHAPTIPWTTLRPVSPALSDTSVSTTTTTRPHTRISSPLSNVITHEWLDDIQPDPPTPQSNPPSTYSYDRSVTGYAHAHGYGYGSRPEGLSPVPSSTYYIGSPELPEIRPLSRLSMSSSRSASVEGTVLGVATSVATSRPGTPALVEAWRRSPLMGYRAGGSSPRPHPRALSPSVSVSPTPSRRLADFDFGFDGHDNTTPTSFTFDTDHNTTPSSFAFESPSFAFNPNPDIDIDTTSLAETATDLSSLPPLTRCTTPALLGLASRIPLPPSRTPTPILIQTPNASARSNPSPAPLLPHPSTPINGIRNVTDRQTVPSSPRSSTPITSTRSQNGTQSATSSRSRFTELFDLDGPSLYAQSQSSQAGLVVDPNGRVDENRIEGFGNGYENGVVVVGDGAQGGGDEEEGDKDERMTEERRRDEEYAETVRRVDEMKRARGWRVRVKRGVVGVVCCGKGKM